MTIFQLYLVTLTAAFVALDVTGKIDWPWWLVTMPVLFGIVIAVLASVAMALPDSRKDD